ncbi:hypothetical protein LXL04_034440 [Taraxacum kok-saghyz]
MQNFTIHHIASFLLYLSDVEERGETMFQFEASPNSGETMLMMQTSVHGSCPVIKGQKWVEKRIWGQFGLCDSTGTNKKLRGNYLFRGQFGLDYTCKVACQQMGLTFKWLFTEEDLTEKKETTASKSEFYFTAGTSDNGRKTRSSRGRYGVSTASSELREGKYGEGKFEDRAIGLRRYTRAEASLRSFENSYIPENLRTPKPLTFSKNRLRGAKNCSNTSPTPIKIIEFENARTNLGHLFFMLKNIIYNMILHIFVLAFSNPIIVILRSFENSYIPENLRTPKPLTFSKNRLRGAKNCSNTSPPPEVGFSKKLTVWEFSVGYPRDAPATVLFGEWFRSGKPKTRRMLH